jgi:hypothetical protein
MIPRNEVGEARPLPVFFHQLAMDDLFGEVRRATGGIDA